MKVAIKVGGSVFCPSDKPDAAFVRKLAGTLIDMSGEHRLMVVVGGGRLARKLIEEAGAKSQDELHELGIKAARMNARRLISELGDHAFPDVPENEGEAAEAFSGGKIVVAGGFRPGQTTDAVTAQSAVAVGAELMIIGTDVKGVYDRDPNRYPDANFMKSISPAELMELSGGEVEPGKKTVVDSVAVALIEKEGLKTVVLDIRDVENLKLAASGGGFEGTLIE